MIKECISRLSRIALLTLLVSYPFFPGCDGGGGGGGGGESTPPPGGQPSAAVLSGIVQDTDGNPLEGVKISAGATSTQSGADGSFTLGGLPEGEEVLLRFEHEEFVTTYQRLKVSGAERMAEVIMVRRGEPASFDAEEGASIETRQKVSLAIPGRSLQDPDGAAYSGAANVEVTFTPSESPLKLQAFPGGFSQLDPDSGQRTFFSVGFLEVNVVDETGRPLQLKDGSEAQISVPLPEALMDSAPASAAVFWLNPETGMWEATGGEAVRKGETYEFSVSHFSLWTVGWAADLSYIRGRVVDCNGDPLGHNLVAAVAQDKRWPWFGAGFTDGNGVFTLQVPAETSLFLGAWIPGEDAPGDVAAIVSPPAGRIKDLKHPLQLCYDTDTWTIRGHLQDAKGNPINKAMIDFSGGCLWERWGTCSADFELEVHGPRDVTLCFDTSRHAKKCLTVKFPGEGEVVDLGNIVLELDTGSVVGRVVNLEGDPVMLATVYIKQVDDEGLHMTATLTDIEGRFELHPRAQNESLIRISCPGGPSREFTFLAPGPGETLDLGVIELPCVSAKIKGRVIDGNTSEPLEGVEVKVFWGQRTYTNSDGRFEMPVAPGWELRIHFRLAGYRTGFRELEGPEAAEILDLGDIRLFRLEEHCGDPEIDGLWEGIFHGNTEQTGPIDYRARYEFSSNLGEFGCSQTIRVKVLEASINGGPWIPFEPPMWLPVGRYLRTGNVVRVQLGSDMLEHWEVVGPGKMHCDDAMLEGLWNTGDLQKIQ